MLFVLNAIAGVVLAIGMLLLRPRLLRAASILSLLFLLVTLAALVLALTVGLFGITQTWDFTLVPQTIVIETIGVVVLAVAAVVAFRAPQAE